MRKYSIYNNNLEGFMLNEIVCVCVCVLLNPICLFVTPWTIACQAVSIEFSKQEHWSGLPFPSPGDLPDLGIEPTFPALQADSLLLSHQG